MATYNVEGWVWAGLGSPMTLSPVTITDDDPTMSPYFTGDATETVTIGGTTYTNPQGGSYELTFTDSDGDTHTEDFLLFNTGANYVFVPLPGSEFDTGSSVDSLGGWQDYTSGFTWADVVCFVGGTLIDTPSGERAIETLAVGDVVKTRDNGHQTITWIGGNHVNFLELRKDNAAKLFPVRIRAGALGCGLPQRDLRVSPQHRILIQSKICNRMFGQSTALIAAKNLVGLPGITREITLTSVTYYHFLLSRHEIVFSDGAASESLFTGAQALKAVSPEARAEILGLFPELSHQDHNPLPAALIPGRKQQQKLIDRHRKNEKPLTEQMRG